MRAVVAPENVLPERPRAPSHQRLHAEGQRVLHLLHGGNRRHVHRRHGDHQAVRGHAERLRPLDGGRRQPARHPVPGHRRQLPPLVRPADHLPPAEAPQVGESVAAAAQAAEDLHRSYQEVLRLHSGPVRLQLPLLPLRPLHPAGIVALPVQAPALRLGPDRPAPLRRRLPHGPARAAAVQGEGGRRRAAGRGRADEELLQVGRRSRAEHRGEVRLYCLFFYV